MAKKRRKYKTDTEAGIRTIRQIDALPSCELTDEEFVKQFYHRFDATALLLAYTDDEGGIHTFGRLKYGKNPGYWYRQLCAILERNLVVDSFSMTKVVSRLEAIEKGLETGDPEEALKTVKALKKGLQNQIDILDIAYNG